MNKVMLLSVATLSISSILPATLQLDTSELHPDSLFTPDEPIAGFFKQSHTKKSTHCPDFSHFHEIIEDKMEEAKKYLLKNNKPQLSHG